MHRPKVVASREAAALVLLCSLAGCLRHEGLARPAPDRDEPDAQAPAPSFPADSLPRALADAQAGEPDARDVPDASLPPPVGVDAGLPDATSVAVDARPSQDAAVDLAPPSIPMDRAASALAAVYCQRRFDCCTSDEIGEVSTAERIRCEGQTTFDLAGPIGDLSAGINRNRVRFDGVRLAADLDRWKTASCLSARDREPLLVLARVVAPLVAPGGSCRRDWECNGGYCPDRPPNQDGVCVTPRLADGEKCLGDGECRSGVCSLATSQCAAATSNSLCQ